MSTNIIIDVLSLSGSQIKFFSLQVFRYFSNRHATTLTDLELNWNILSCIYGVIHHDLYISGELFEAGEGG